MVVARLSPLQIILICAFCIYWCVIFPLLWFVLKPQFVTDDFWEIIFYAMFLFFVYGILHLLILIIYKCCERRWRKNDTTSLGEEQPKLNAVIYEKRPELTTANETDGRGDGINGVREYNPNLRFTSSCKLFYDGRKFRDSSAPVSKY